MTEALNAFSMYNSPRSGFSTTRRDKELGPSITPGLEGADTFGRTYVLLNRKFDHSK
jgi:hypothetical protein